uniref:Uncharacterized protein n=1 Tax=Fervidicoccus fontis TaxID=683846 RepID=A0A7J3SL45_9CREN
MRANIRRIARRLREAAEELDRIYVIKRGQPKFLPSELRGLTRAELVEKLVGFGSKVPLDFPAGVGYFTVEKTSFDDEVWKGEDIYLEGTLEWLGKRFSHAESWLRIHPDGSWEILIDDVVVYLSQPWNGRDYWYPYEWESYTEKFRKHVLSVGEKIS